MNEPWENSQIAKFGDVCEYAARSGGEVLRSFRGRVSATSKGPFDVVTEADFAAQQAVREVVLGEFPGHGFLGEENDGFLDSLAEQGDAPCWIVDPLDGTTNYLHGVPHYCVSVALAAGNRVLVGAVFDPEKDECFTAYLGGGARLNGEAIHTSAESDRQRALLAANLPNIVQSDSDELKRFAQMVTHIPSIRRMGSAALNMCYLAAGRFNGYWATSVKPWDIAAGVLMVWEAGGIITSIDGGEFELRDPRFVAAGTSQLHAELLEILRQV